MTTTSTINPWGEIVARYLQDATVCPVCGHGQLDAGCCSSCAADLRGPIGQELWEASRAAAAAVRARDSILHRVPKLAASTTPAPVSMPRETAAASSDSFEQAPVRGGSTTLQSVLAIAGAGLFAIAAIIFTFLNPDLSDRALRSVIVGSVTLVFLGGSWLLARRGLQFSAEAVGGLGLVFVGLDVYAFSQIAPTMQATWLLAALSTAVAGCVMGIAALLARIRVWGWGAVLSIAAVPAFAGYSASSGFVVALGHLGTAVIAGVLIERASRLGAQPVLVGVQLVATLSAVPVVVLGASHTAPLLGSSRTAPLLEVSVIFALIALSALFATRQRLAGWWSLVAGGAANLAVIIAVMALVTGAPYEWLVAIVPTTAALAFALVAVLPLPETVVRPILAGGAIVVLLAISLMPLAFAATTGLGALALLVRGEAAEQFITPNAASWGFVLGLGGIATGLALFGLLSRLRSSLRGLARVTEVAAVCFAAVAVLTLCCLPLLPLTWRVAIVLGSAGLAAITLRGVPFVRDAREGVRVALGTAAHFAVLVGIVISWSDSQTAPLMGVGVIIVLALLGSIMSTGFRFLYVGAGFAYALICVGHALSQTALGNIAVLCLTTAAGLLVAIAVTFLPRIGVRSWYAVLVVTAVPFVAGIAQVVFERSGWTALSTALMFALALSLMITKRAGLNIALRTTASALLVPTVAVVVVCLGAQLLAVSASPVTLPVIAAVVALVLPSTTVIRAALLRHGIDQAAASAARLAIELSALCTGIIAVVLAVAREAAGLGTTFLVLIVLGLGAAASAMLAGRRYGWWAAGAAFTGALWCVWGMNGVDVLEAYLLPPALGAALVAVVLTARGADARGLYASAAAIAVAPTLALLVLAEPDAATAVTVPWRALVLLAAAGIVLALGWQFAKAERWRTLAMPTLIAAGVAAIAGPVQGIRMGTALDLTFLGGISLFLACFGVSAFAALILTLVARGIRFAAAEDSRLRASRWLYAPAVLALAAGTWSAIERDWGSIWAMWALMLAFLVALLMAALRAEKTLLPPVWFLFAVSFVTAVVAWTPRDLRVEWFSLPLGAFLLAAGVVGLRANAGRGEGVDAAAPRSLTQWPARWRGSWPLLAPGIITMMSASIVATFTDPLTWRAILVMVLALAAILVGAGRRLAAPFLLGMLVLPIENVFVFSVQIGRGIESMPWWITLAVVGAVLLIIAVTYERRTGDADTVTARIRDLR